MYKKTINPKKMLKNSKVLAVGLILSFVLASNLVGLTAFAQTSGASRSNLIIGKTETNTSVELSVCVQATPGPLNLGNVSTWFEFDSTFLSTTPNAFLDKGQYGNSNNGYGSLKWQEVTGSQNGNFKTYSMRLDYSDLTGGIGLPMSTNKELYGKVSFVKSTSTTNPTINLTKNQFFTTQNSNIPIKQQVTYVSEDCRSNTYNQGVMPNGKEATIFNNPAANTIAKPEIQNNNTSEKPVAQEVDLVSRIQNIATQSGVAANKDLEQIQAQSDYQSVRTGGLDSLLIFIVTAITLTSVLITIKSNYKASLFNK